MEREWTKPSSLVLIAGILVVLNILGMNWFVRMDLTDDQVYSLSDYSIDLVESLEDPITVTAYFAQDLPAPYSSTRRFVKDKLAEYRAYGGDAFQYQFADPSTNQEIRREAQRYGIPPVQIQTVDNNNMQVKRAFMGLAIEYQDSREVIPVVRQRSRLEYKITSAVSRLVSEQLPTVGFLTGHGEPGLKRALRGLQQGLQKNYQVMSVSVQDSTLEPAPDVLMVVAPSDTIPQNHLRAIDQFIMNGGRAAFMINRVRANLQRGQAVPQQIGLNRLLSSYGIHLNRDLVMDRQSSRVSIQQRRGGFPVSRSIRYPFLPVVQNFNSNHAMTQGLRRTLFYFASSIDTSATVSGVSVEPLAFSSANSGRQQKRFMIRPAMARQQMGSLSNGPFVLAAAYSGQFPSAFQNGRQSSPTRIVAVGDGDFVNQSVLGQQTARQNMQLALNAADWLGQDEALLEIRSKTVEPRRLRSVSDSLKPWIKYANMIGPGLLVIFIGLLRWRLKSARHVSLDHSSQS